GRRCLRLGGGLAGGGRRGGRERGPRHLGPLGQGVAPRGTPGGVWGHLGAEGRAQPAAAVLQADRGDRLDHGLVPRVRPGHPVGVPGPARPGGRGLRPGRVPAGPRAPGAGGTAGQSRASTRRVGSYSPSDRSGVRSWGDGADDGASATSTAPETLGWRGEGATVAGRGGGRGAPRP